MDDLLSFSRIIVNAHFAAKELVEEYGAGDRDVEGRNLAQHRDTDKKIAFFLNYRPKPATFTAQNNSQALGKIPAVKVLIGLSMETYDPKTALL